VDGPLRAESFLFVHCTVYLSIELRVEVITLRTGPAVKVDQLLCSIQEVVIAYAEFSAFWRVFQVLLA
jgi:hypothetical protein